MEINPFFVLIALGLAVYLYSYIRKIYILLPKEFKEIEDKYVPELLKNNIKKTWYIQREFNSKYIMKKFPIIFLGFSLLLLLKYLFDIETRIFLNFIKYSIIIAVIIICFVKTYYYIKIYRKYKDLYKGLDVKLREKVLKFTIMQCIGFIVRVILVIFILR